MSTVAWTEAKEPTPCVFEPANKFSLDRFLSVLHVNILANANVRAGFSLRAFVGGFPGPARPLGVPNEPTAARPTELATPCLAKPADGQRRGTSRATLPHFFLLILDAIARRSRENQLVYEYSMNVFVCAKWLACLWLRLPSAPRTNPTMPAIVATETARARARATTSYIRRSWANGCSCWWTRFMRSFSIEISTTRSYNRYSSWRDRFTISVPGHYFCYVDWLILIHEETIRLNEILRSI